MEMQATTYFVGHVEVVGNEFAILDDDRVAWIGIVEYLCSAVY